MGTLRKSVRTVVGEYHRLNGSACDTDANVSAKPWTDSSNWIAHPAPGELPRGVKVTVRGQIGPMKQTLANLGVVCARVLVIYLLLAATFQS